MLIYRNNELRNKEYAIFLKAVLKYKRRLHKKRKN